MQRRTFFTRFGAGTLTMLTAFPFLSSAMKIKKHRKKESFLKKDDIQHMVIFDFKSS